MAQSQIKKKPSDFIFGKVIGEGSFATVFLAKEISTKKEFAIKVVEKRHIMKERKQQYVQREKEVLLRINHPFFIKLHFTFQDEDRLYFGLSYASRGELLDYIKRLGCFDENCTKFYAAEIVDALQYLHSICIIHRDMKPENILLNDEMHIQITDFGSAKIMNNEKSSEAAPVDNGKSSSNENKRKNSFVGTAQYVSPEILKSSPCCYSSDLWALGCIIYQLLSGQHPFYGSHEYQIFQKILKLEYEIPKGFNEKAKDLVQKLLVIEPASRLGSEEMGGYEKLKSHEFFSGVEWESLHLQTPPELQPYLPATSKDDENLWSQYKPGLNEQQLSHLLGGDLAISKRVSEKVPEPSTWVSDDERRAKLEIQSQTNEFHRFVQGNLILKQSLLDKRKGLFARRRMFLLTEGPRLFYVDPANMVLKGEIPWSKDLRPETKNFKIFFVHTPNRTYYLEDPEGNALKWCAKIEEVLQHYFQPKT